MRALALSILLFCVLAMPPVLAAVSASEGAPPGPIVVLHGPWTDGAALARHAGGWAVGPVTAPLGTLATAPDPDHFAQRLRAAGAWAVLDGRALAILCGLSPDAIAESSLRTPGRIPLS